MPANCWPLLQIHCKLEKKKKNMLVRHHDTVVLTYDCWWLPFPDTVLCCPLSISADIVALVRDCWTHTPAHLWEAALGIRDQQAMAMCDRTHIDHYLVMPAIPLSSWPFLLLRLLPSLLTLTTCMPSTFILIDLKQNLSSKKKRCREHILPMT